jgi:hypothetical protein
MSYYKIICECKHIKHINYIHVFIIKCVWSLQAYDNYVVLLLCKPLTNYDMHLLCMIDKLSCILLFFFLFFCLVFYVGCTLIYDGKVITYMFSIITYNNIKYYNTYINIGTY